MNISMRPKLSHSFFWSEGEEQGSLNGLQVILGDLKEVTSGCKCFPCTYILVILFFHLLFITCTLGNLFRVTLLCVFVHITVQPLLTVQLLVSAGKLLRK